jgi:DNA-binding MarR family transcriptional regulator
VGGRVVMAPRETAPASAVVMKLLAAGRDTTVAELAGSAGLSESTVSKTLTALEAAGTAIRTPGGRDGARRLPDRWAARTKPRRAKPTTPTKRAAAATTKPRLGRGQLRDRVLAQLRTHTEPVGPSALARALDASSGAVGNALDRLVEMGLATRVGERPRRYRATAAKR